MAAQEILRDMAPTFVRLELLEDNGSGKCVVRGEFARAGVPTNNGRTYTRSILEREIHRLQSDIQARRLFGEADHPCFTSDDFRVLTVGGWKPFGEIREGDKVWSRVDGEAVLSTVTGITNEPYSGKAYHVKGRSIDSTFTPGHRFVLSHRPKRGTTASEDYVTVADLKSDLNKYRHWAIPKTARWLSSRPEFVAIPGVEGTGTSSLNDTTKDLCLDPKLFAAFMGVYLSEGSCSSDSSDNYIVNISQKTEWSKRFIYDEVLSKMHPELEWRDIKTGFAVSDKRLYTYLKPIGDCYSKYVPEEARSLDPESLRELIFWFCIGAGRMVASSGSKRRDFMGDADISFKQAMAEILREGHAPPARYDIFSVSEHLIHGLHECLVKSGGSGTISTVITENDYEFAGRTIKAADKSPLHQLHISITENVWMDPRFISIEELQHDGNIYCLSVTHGNFYAEQSGKSFWTGNSDGRTKLSRVSHLITNLTIKPDGVVLGEAEILDTDSGKNLKSILQAGCAVGVSSRGLGSTRRTQEGNEVVNEDFVLKTWDFVVDPAAPTAYPGVFSEATTELEKETVETEDESMATELTVESLRESNPGLVKKIEEAAKVSAKEALEEEFSEKLSSVKTNLREEIVSDLQDRFGAKLVERLSEIKESMAKEMESKMLSDPNVAASKQTIDILKERLRPFLLPEDVKEVLEEERSKRKEVMAEVDRKQAEIDELKRVSEDITGLARKMGYELYVERRLRGLEFADEVREAVGDLSQYTSKDSMQKAVNGAIRGQKNRRAEIQAVEEASIKERERIQEQVEEDKAHLLDKLENIEEYIRKKEDENQRLQEGVDRALKLARNLGLRAYVEQRLQGNPSASRIRHILESVEPSTPEEIDQLVTSLTEERKPSRERRLMESRRASRAKVLTEETEVQTPSRKVRSKGIPGFDGDMNDIRRLAGM